jgi:hypothetical protein
VLDQELGLLFAPAAMEGKVHIELYGIHPYEPVHQFSWTIEYAAGLGIVGDRWSHQENVGSFANRFQPEIFS